MLQRTHCSNRYVTYATQRDVADMVWCRKLGAKHYLLWTNKEEMDARKASLDLIINTGSILVFYLCYLKWFSLYVAGYGWRKRNHFASV